MYTKHEIHKFSETVNLACLHILITINNQQSITLNRQSTMRIDARISLIKFMTYILTT